LQGTSASTATGACAGITFSRNLTVGATGSDVKCLQSILNRSTATQVAASGVGSAGYESTTFGPKTLVAVKKWQAANGLTPANQVGPLSRAKLNAAIGTVVVTPGQPPVVVPTGAGVTVMLASDSPAATTVVGGASPQALAPLARLVFANGDNASVNITRIALQRIGLSADADLQNVYLFQGANRLTDAASVSAGNITFNAPNGIFTLASGASTEITVYADLAISSTAGETLGVALPSSASVTSNASSVKGNFPVTGNLMTVATASLATLTFQPGTTPSGTPTIQAAPATVVFEDLLNVGNRAVNLQWIRLRDIGSAEYSAIQNLKLYVDGVQVGQTVSGLDTNGYVTFDMTSAPVSLQTGNRDIKVLADINGGSNRTISFSVYVAADVRATDSQYGANVFPASISNAATGTITIAQGAITIQKATNSPSGNVVNNASNVDLGDFTLTASGEAVKIQTINAAVVCSVGGTSTALRNGALYANGVQVGSTANLNCTSNTTPYTTFQLGSSLIVTPETPVTLSVKADVYSQAGTAQTNGASLQAELVATTGSNAQGQTSLVTLYVPTASTTVTANQITIAQGTLTLSKYTAYTNQTTAVPQTKYQLAHFTLTGSTTEAINLSTLYVTLNDAVSNASQTIASNLYVQFGTQTTQTITTPVGGTNGNAFSVSYQLPAGQTVDVIVYADVNSAATLTGSASVKITGTTASSGQAVNTGNSAVAGQTITFGSGSISAVVDGSTPLAQVVAGNQQVSVAKFKFTAQNDNYTVSEAKFTVNSNNGAVINSAILKDGSTVLGTMPFDSTNNWFYFTGLNVSVPSNTTKILTVDLSLATPYTNGPTGTTVTTGKDVAITLSYVKTLNGSGVTHDAGSGTLLSTDASVKIAGSTTGTSGANDMYVYKTIPTFTAGTVTGQGTNLSSGSTTNLYSFSVAADAKGSVAVRQLKFNVAINDVNTAVVARLSNFKFYRGSTDLTTSSVTIQTTAAASLEGATTITGTSTVVVTFSPEEVVPAGSSYAYTLKATPAGFSTSTTGNDSVSTSLVLDGSNETSASGAKYLASAGNAATAVQSLATTVNQTTGTDANVIWSDNSAQAHDYSDSASTSNDWFNGYLIQNLPLESIGVSAQ
jgi:hypothetical protein